jgi:hypothetical protein
MSKIAVKGNASGTGTFTIESPNSNTDRTFNLPDASGVVLTDVSDITAQVKTATNASGSAPVYACRAWVNFDGLNGAGDTIRASGNVSSVARNGTGDYTVNFTTAMPDANYAIACASDRARNPGAIVVLDVSFVRYLCQGGASSTADQNTEFSTCVVFR